MGNGKLENERLIMESDVYPFVEDLKKKWKDKLYNLNFERT
jgi:hypothetical protein